MDEHSDLAMTAGKRVFNPKTIAIKPDELARRLDAQQKKLREEGRAKHTSSQEEKRRRESLRTRIRTELLALEDEWRRLFDPPLNGNDPVRKERINRQAAELREEMRVLEQLEEAEQAYELAQGTKKLTMQEAHLNAVLRRQQQGYKPHSLDLVLQGIFSDLKADEVLMLYVGKLPHWYCGLELLIKLQKDHTVRFVAERITRG